MRPARPARLLAPLAVLLLALALCASALASVTGPHGSTARSRSTKTARHGRKRHARHHVKRHAAHKTRKAAKHSSASALELVPAACEDGTLPSHSGGGEYSCEDGSAPACEEGTLRAAASAPPMCAVKATSEGECARGGGECGDGVEFDCEDSSSDEAPGSCERPEEGEASEEEE